MDQAESTLEDIRSVEDPHLLRLTSVLHEMVRRGGLKGAARELGIDHRTVGASLDEGRLTRRCREALERTLIERADTDVAEQARRLDALEETVGALTEEVRAGLDVVRAAGEQRDAALREEFARGMGRIGRRLAEMEAATGGAAAAQVARPDIRPVAVLRREHPELVTREPAPDDPDVFGGAWPLVRQWRALKDTHPDGGKGLAWLVDEERLLEVEVTLLTEFGMTLPPETEPLRGFGRVGQLNWRRTALSDTRRALARRRLVRRVLTLGLWQWWTSRR